MAKYNYNLHVDKLFEEYDVEEIIEIERTLDIEIEKKRSELRGMVGDRYKDVLTASDAIKSMQSISETIVSNIEGIANKCEELINSTDDSNKKHTPVVNNKIIEERTVIMQVRLAIVICDQIWLALDRDDFCTAAQLYLLAQHVHTGLRLLNDKVLQKLPILKRMKADVDALRNRILKRVKEKLQNVQLSAKETSSNLNALMLLQNQSITELLNIFIELRSKALGMVVNHSHQSVRTQITAMVQCLIATVHLLHNCFISHENNKIGLIGQQLQDIIKEDAAPTLSKVALPPTPLLTYIPKIIQEFRPKYENHKVSLQASDVDSIIKKWLAVTTESIKNGLTNTLELVTTVKGLHIIREEALKSELPKDWDTICRDLNLPNNFNTWQYFFQGLITNRAQSIITKKICTIRLDLQSEIKNIKTQDVEEDLVGCTWKEDASDISRSENKHVGLSMKIKGYSLNIVKLCQKWDDSCLNCLTDLTSYLYGTELDTNDSSMNHFLTKVGNFSKKFVDRESLESHIRLECRKNSTELTAFIGDFVKSETNVDVHISKSLMCARLLQALAVLCPHFKICCCCNGVTTEYEAICDTFGQFSLQLWQNWTDHCNNSISERAGELLNNVDDLNMLDMLPKWDMTEIQEQTDEKTFKSQIKVPSQPSLVLQLIVTDLNNKINDVLPHTIPKPIHQLYIEKNMLTIIGRYETLIDKDLSQIQALQFLFDVKFLSTFCIPRENIQLVSKSQSICDKLRSKIDPFDLDVFYSYLQNNVKRCAVQSQVILGCLLPNPGQLASLGVLEKNKEQEKDPSVLAVSVPTSNVWFPLLPVTAPIQKTVTPVSHVYKDVKISTKPSKKTSEGTGSVRSGAVALLGAMANDWFS